MFHTALQSFYNKESGKGQWRAKYLIGILGTSCCPCEVDRSAGNVIFNNSLIKLLKTVLYSRPSQLPYCTELSCSTHTHTLVNESVWGSLRIYTKTSCVWLLYPHSFPFSIIFQHYSVSLRTPILYVLFTISLFAFLFFGLFFWVCEFLFRNVCPVWSTVYVTSFWCLFYHHNFPDFWLFFSLSCFSSFCSGVQALMSLKRIPCGWLKFGWMIMPNIIISG